jgi:cold shock protein
MGRYKEYREPRRRGFDDDMGSSDRPARGNRPSYQRSDAPQAPRSAAPQGGGAPVDATVKWFNAEKGFGFVSVDGGSEAFLHIRQLQTAGHTSVPEGARLKVQVGQGQKGPEVTQVIEVDVSTAAPASSQERRRPPAASQPMGQTREGLGTVKMYKVDKGFGFISPDDGGKDVFVHATTLARVGLKALSDGQRVRMQVGQGKKGLEAQAIELLD